MKYGFFLKKKKIQWKKTLKYLGLASLRNKLITYKDSWSRFHIWTTYIVHVEIKTILLIVYQSHLSHSVWESEKQDRIDKVKQEFWWIGWRKSSRKLLQETKTNTKRKANWKKWAMLVRVTAKCHTWSSFFGEMSPPIFGFFPVPIFMLLFWLGKDVSARFL